MPGSSPIESRATFGDAMPKRWRREDRPHLRELHQPVGLHLGVGAGVEQHGRLTAGHRDDRGDRRPVDTLDAPHPQQRRGHRGAGVAGRDHGGRLAVAHRLGGAHQRGILLATDGAAAVLVHLDDLARRDQREVTDVDPIGEIGRADEHDRGARRGGSLRTGDDRAGCVVAAHRVDRNGQHVRVLSRLRRRRGSCTSRTTDTPCAGSSRCHSAGTCSGPGPPASTHRRGGCGSSSSTSSSSERPRRVSRI